LCYVFVLRLCVTSLCYVFVLRLCVTPLCYAFVLRLCATSSILPEVSIELPFAVLPDILLPLLALRLYESLVYVCALRVADDVVLLEHVERFVQIARQLVDAVLAPLAKAHGEDVFVHRIGRDELLLDAVEAGGELDREGEVRIRRW